MAYPLAAAADTATIYNAGNTPGYYGTVNQNNVPVIGSEACGPTSGINSYTYLQNQNPSIYGNNLVSNTPISDVQVMGSTFYMNTSATIGTWYRDYLWGKYLYMEYSVPLNTAYTARVPDQGTYDSSNIGGWTKERPQPAWMTVTSNPTNAYDAWNFIYSNLQNHADVGIGIQYLNGGGHFLSVIRFRFTDTNGDKKIAKDENAQLTLMDPWTGQITTCQIWNSSDYNNYLYINYDGGAIIYVEMAETPGTQPVPQSVDQGNILLLRTTSTYSNLTLNGGVLLLGDPQVAWTRNFSAAAGTSTILNTAGYSCTLSGALTGSGNLTQMKSGTVIFQGNGAGFTGTYTVDTGTLTLDNTLGSTSGPCTVVTNYGGTLKGSGMLVGTLNNSGTTNPGDSPGTLRVVGSYTHTSTGSLIAEIASPSTYDKVVVTGVPGTANLDGTVAPTLLGGYRPRGNQVFPAVITATGGISGAFSTILNQQISPTLFWQARYHPTSVDLWVQRNYTNSGLGLNSNQQAVGTMLNGVAGVTSGDLDTVMNAIDYLPDSAGVRDAFKQISPEKAGALTNLGFAAANFQMRNLATRTTNLRFVQGEASGGSGLMGGGLNFNYSKLDGPMLAYNGASLSNLFSARKEFQAPESRWGVYMDGGAAFGSQNSSVNQTGYNFTLGGFTLGADYRLLDNFLVGLATGYSNTSAGFYGSGGNVNANTIPFNAYAAYFPGSLYAYTSVGYALNLFDLKRGISFDSIARTASSSTTGNQFNLYGETGYDLKLSRVILTPSATLAYSALWVGGFTEQGAGAINLKVAPQTASSLQTGLGGRLTVPLQAGSVKVVPQGYAFYQHEFANGSRGLNASLSQGSSTFNFQTDAAKRNYALVGASVTVGLKKNLYAQANYNTEVGRANYTAQNINAGLRFDF